MPVTINQNKVKFKHPTKQGFIAFDTVASETSQQLQVQLQQKATEIRKSWPENYNNLTDKVNNLVKFQDTAPSTSSTTQVWVDTSSNAAQVAVPTMEEFDDLKGALPQWVDNLDNGKRIFEYVWGNIPSSGVVDYNYTPRVRIVTADYAKFATATVLTVESGYGCIFALYDDTYTKTSRVIYNGPAEITCPANIYYRVCIFHAIEVPSEIADFADKVWYQSAINKQTTALSGGGYLLKTISSLDNVASNVMDADQTYGVYRYAASATSAPSASSGAVMVYRAGATYVSEIAMPTTGGIYSRYCENGTWSSWINTDAEIKSLTNGGYPLTLVTSLDSIGSNIMDTDAVYGIYRYTSSATSAPSISSGAVLVYRAGAAYQSQVAMPVTGGIYSRYCENGTWSGWINLEDKNSAIEYLDVGTGQTYSTFTSAFTYAKANSRKLYGIRLHGSYTMDSTTDDLTTDSGGQGLAVPYNVVRIIGNGKLENNVITFTGTTQQSPFYLLRSVDIENIYFVCTSKYCIIIDDGKNIGQVFNIKGNRFKLISGGSGCIGIGMHECKINITDNYFEQGTDSGVRAHNWDYGNSFGQHLNISGNYFTDNMVCAIHLYTVNRYNNRGWAKAFINENEFNTRGIVLSEENASVYGYGNLWEVYGHNNSNVSVTITHHDDTDYTDCVRMFLPSITVTDTKIE